MRWNDTGALALESLRGHRVRTALSAVAVGIGATAVLLLTALGDAAKGYVEDQFSALGTNLVAATRGRTQTTGGMPVGLGTTRDLTLEDAVALRRVPGAVEVLPGVLGAGAVEFGTRSRSVFVLGVTAPYARVSDMRMALGEFLPAGDLGRDLPVAVLGDKLRRQLFDDANPVGQSVRIANARFRVIGAFERKGSSFGMDFDDMAYVPVASAMRVFGQRGLYRITVEARDATALPGVIAGVREVLVDRHRAEDFTLVTPDAMLESFHAILNTLTLALAGIAAISFAVAGIGIMNVMLVAVSERVAEVGLLKALGARPGQVTALFLTESLLLSGLGAVAGLAAGMTIAALAGRLFPALPLRPALHWMAAVVGLALVTGGAFGLMPARRAARLPAAEALSRR